MKDTIHPISPDSSKDYSNLVGIPYSEMNCWELAQAFYSQVLGVQLKHYYLDAPRDRLETQSLIYSSKGDFRKVHMAMFSDIILLKIRGIESHIAIYLGGGLMLHTDKHRGSYIDRVERWSKTITGYYRLTEQGGK